MSVASVWELSLQHHQGKLPELSGAISDLPGLLQADGFEPLSGHQRGAQPLRQEARSTHVRT
ncbi:MAG: hypothetical protein R6W06_09755 [Prochlorococcaceae cyanobacterium]